jgi:hypothetical protein
MSDGGCAAALDFKAQLLPHNLRDRFSELTKQNLSINCLMTDD